MNIVGYLLLLSNIQSFGGRSPDVKDLSLKIGTLADLADYLKKCPQFTLEGFKKNLVNRVGNVGMYLSEELWDYYLNGRGSPNHEAALVTITYKTPGDPIENDENEIILANQPFLFLRKSLSKEKLQFLLQNKLRYENVRRTKRFTVDTEA